jgi:hypothetical protein
MVKYKKDCGKIINWMGLEEWFLRQVIGTLGFIKIIRKTAKVLIIAKMAESILVLGLIIWEKVMEKKNGLMVIHTKVNGQKIKCMVKVLFIRKMAKSILVLGLIIWEKVMENSNGLMVIHTKVNGQKINSTAKVHTDGLMVREKNVNMLMENSKNEFWKFKISQNKQSMRLSIWRLKIRRQFNEQTNICVLIETNY